MSKEDYQDLIHSGSVRHRGANSSDLGTDTVFGANSHELKKNN
jgi:hypothetical protein